MSVAAAPSPPFSATTPRRPTLAGAVGGELLKISGIRPVRAVVALALLAAVPTLLVVAAYTPQTMAGPRRPEESFDLVLSVLEAIFLGGAFPFLAALAAMVVAMEYGHGTIRVLLARGAGRTRLLAAKLLALAAACLGLLGAYATLTLVVFGPAMLVWGVSPHAIVTAPWGDVLLSLVTTGAAMAVAILARATAAVVGRSFAAALIVGACFFIADSVLLPVLTRGLTVNVSLGVQLGKLIVFLRLPQLANGHAADGAQGAVVVAAWLVAFGALSFHLVRARDVLE
jgi:ABC-2 type transport system permease protein